MIGAYADAARILKDERYRKAAETAADFLLTTHRAEDGRLLRTSRAGKAKGAGYLEDYAFLAQGLLRLHDATGDPRRLDQARALTDRMLADFTDAENGGFFSTASDGEVLIARPKDAFDNAIPGGNSVAIRNLVELARKTGEARYLDAAGKALEGFSALLQRAPAGAPLMLVGLDEYLDARPAAAKANPLDALKPAAAPIGEVLKVAAIRAEIGEGRRGVRRHPHDRAGRRLAHRGESQRVGRPQADRRRTGRRRPGDGHERDLSRGPGQGPRRLRRHQAAHL